MKKVEMRFIVTEFNNDKNKQVKTFVSLDTDYASGWGLPMHANRTIISEEIKMVDILEVGDRVACEVFRGATQDDDGLSCGGRWVTKTGVVKSDSPYGCDGFVSFDDGDMQALSLIRGDRGYPGKNIQPAI